MDIPKNARGGVQGCVVLRSICHLWLDSTKLAAVKYKWKNCDCFLVWMQIDRIFRQGHCILTILHYVCRISSLGACNGALFMAQPHHHWHPWFVFCGHDFGKNLETRGRVHTWKGCASHTQIRPKYALVVRSPCPSWTIPITSLWLQWTWLLMCISPHHYL